ncbi:MAG: DUF4258 domain-containing protein [Bacteroidota bacterium]|nr:DUF4258 domain-containing protein [Bacteroidota bacterium]
MNIIFSDHAIAKIEILKRHGIEIENKFIELVVTEPEKLEEGYKKRLIAQREFDDGHVLRVVYEKINNDILIITIYPGRSKRYDKSEI